MSGLHRSFVYSPVVRREPIAIKTSGYAPGISTPVREEIMSKGKDRKKQEKKKPMRTLMEKRADKKAKKESKSFSLIVK